MASASFASRLIALIRRLAWTGRALPIRSGPAQGLRFKQSGSRIDFASGTNEPHVQRCLADTLRRGDVVLDVGANYGFLTVVAAHLVGGSASNTKGAQDWGHVYAFEPVPRNADRIRTNIALNGLRNVTVIPSAAADKSGRLELILTRHPGGAVLASSSPPPPDARNRISVETVVIDDLVDSGAVRPPNFIKIDVEGAEFTVLAGLERTIAAHSPTLLVEFDGPAQADVASKLARFEAWSAGHRYTATQLPRDYADSGWCVVHVLAVRR